MNRVLIFITILSLLTIGTPAVAKDKYYRIQKDVTVLVFLGDPGSRRCDTTRYTTSHPQKIKLLHKRSGPGVYAFHLKGLLIKDETGAHMITEEGYFLARTRYIKPIK